MSRFVEAKNDESLTATEAVAGFSKLRQVDASFIEDAANILLGLYNNRTLLSVPLSTFLRSYPKRAAFYSPQSFLIGTGKFADGKNFVLRGNVWFPRTFDEANQRLENYVYSYDNCHDHNFEFLTVGYFGPGYTTEIYEYDRDKIVGQAGEPVALTPLGNFVLAPGKILHFRKMIDVHLQCHPDETSISLNLLINDDENELAQYEIDPKSRTIKNTIYSSSMYPASLAYLAGKLSCSEAAEEAYRNLKSSPMWQQRYAAGRALLETESTKDIASIRAELNLPAGIDITLAEQL
jgi:hypothetical protein